MKGVKISAARGWGTKKKQIFIQDCGIFRHEFVVATGYTVDEISEWAKKQKIKGEYLDFLKGIETDAIQSGILTGQLNYDNKLQRMALVTKEFVNEWEYWEIILHEITHATQQITLWNFLQGEHECQAYLTEYLFRNIRRKLQGVDKY